MDLFSNCEQQKMRSEASLSSLGVTLPSGGFPRFDINAIFIKCFSFVSDVSLGLLNQWW